MADLSIRVGNHDLTATWSGSTGRSLARPGVW